MHTLAKQATISIPLRRLGPAGPRICAGIAAALAILALAGWALDRAPLRAIGSQLVAMNPLTAACLLLLSAGIFVLSGSPTPAARRVADVAAVLVMVLGLGRLVAYVGGWSFGLDRIAFAARVATETRGGNQVAPNTALCMILLSGALLFEGRGRRRTMEPADLLALAAFGLTSLVVLGYAYGANAFVGVSGFIPMALNTALAFALLATGLLLLNPERGLVALVSGTGVAESGVRRLVPSVLAILAIVGWLFVSAERAGIVDMALGAALVVVFAGAALVALLIRHAVLVHRTEARRVAAEQALATERRRAMQEIEGLNAELSRRVAELTVVNDELEAFSYSVSHDLRAPLRAIDGFSRILVSEYAATLPPEAKGHLQRVRSGAQRMGQLIDDLLTLSRIARTELKPERVDLAEFADEVLAELRDGDPERAVEFIAQRPIVVHGDRGLLHAVMENLIGNAWKFTARTPSPRIELTTCSKPGRPTVIQVRDNGAGFDMQYAQNLFGAFQRLHQVTEFHGHGIGLATVRRIVHRHGGRVWGEGAVGQGATFSFTLEPDPDGEMEE